MRTKSFSAIAWSALVLMPTGPAAAHWQFTTWGMSPKQVVAKSGGRAKEIDTPETKPGQTLIPKLSMPYMSGNLNFSAVFYFDASDRLANVSLKLMNGDPALLQGALTLKYGKPRSDHYGLQQWFSAGDQIVLVDDPGEISYTPRVGGDNSGL